MRRLMLGLAFLAVAVPATADPILPTNYDTVLIGGLVASSSDPINTAAPPPVFMGVLESRVFFDGSVYTYVNTVTPTIDDVTHFNTAFTVAGFTGVAGYSFSDTFGVGATGTNVDFFTATVNDRIQWLGLDRGLADNWDAGESIRFFFRSTKPPTVGDYNLLNGEAGTGTGFEPVPEPGTIALLGSGLVGLYARHRRKQKSGTAQA